MEQTKTCTCCKQTKPIEEFKWRNKKMGEKAGICKKCSNERNKTYPKKKKYKEVKLNFSEEEMALIKEHASESNTTTGRYLKKLALDKKIGKEIIWKDIKNPKQIIAMQSIINHQVKRIGNNINQLAYAYNSTGDINQPGMNNLPAYMIHIIKLLENFEELLKDGIV